MSLKCVMDIIQFTCVFLTILGPIRTGVLILNYKILLPPLFSESLFLILMPWSRWSCESSGLQPV